MEEADLKKLITPSLLDLMVEACIPFSTTETLDFADVGRGIFLAGNLAPRIKEAAWPALVALSRVGLDNMPDLLSLLPPPSSPEFPRRCLGLQLLLDQAPRALLRGVDKRWQTSYFDVVSRGLAAAWLGLPERDRPDSRDRWLGEAGTTLDYWLVARLWFGAPFVHSESEGNQQIALDFTDATRRVIEAESGTRDPYREKRDEVLADIYGFPRVVVAGPPQGPDVTRESWCWWYAMLMDIHKPIIDKFGRYPYNNAAAGRESTSEELEWIEKVDRFAQASPKVAEQIREDIQAGRWQPLGSGGS